MRKSKRRVGSSGSHWDSFTDEQLLAVELQTDDPENLPGIVFELPINEAEPHVEYAYDLRKSGHKRFRCVHGNHGHLAGFVINKGGARFLVGHVCGKKLYNEDFDRYTKDFYTAVERRDVARRLREMRAFAGPFTAWLEALPKQAVFSYYENFRRHFETEMEWLWRKLADAAAFGRILQTVKVPATLFFQKTDPRTTCLKAASELSRLVMTMVAKPDQDENTQMRLGQVREALGRLEHVIDQLQEIVDFFQPEVLEPVCGWATGTHNPSKRAYKPGLMKLSIVEDEKEVVQIQVPEKYQVPDRGMIQKFRLAISGTTVNEPREAAE